MNITSDFLTYRIDITQDELNRSVSPIHSKVGGRVIVYNGERGTDYIHFGINDGKVMMTLLVVERTLIPH